jgi:hypothetical protein
MRPGWCCRCPRDVVNFEVLVVVAAPADVAFEVQVHADKRFDGHVDAEVQGEARRLFEVVDGARDGQVVDAVEGGHFGRADLRARTAFVVLKRRDRAPRQRLRVARETGWEVHADVPDGAFRFCAEQPVWSLWL